MDSIHHLKGVHGFTVRQEVWAIGGRSFRLTWPADVDGLLDLPDTAERFARDEYMPYWAQPWPASVLLAEAVMRGPEGKGRPAVEIGCGIGLVSLAAAARGWSVTASDYDEDAIAFAEDNARANGLTLAACAPIDFRNPPAEPAWVCILGADLLYERRNARPVARWIAAALDTGGSALICDPNRSAADGFPDEAAACQLTTTVTAVEARTPAGLITRGRIWRVTR